MIVNYYSSDNESSICEFEDLISETYIELLNSFKDIVARYDCTMDVVRYWYNSITGKVSADRLPFTNGYLCGLSCQILYNGTLVEFEDDEIALTESWFFSSVREKKHFPCFWNSHLEVVLSTEISDVEEKLNEWIQLLQSRSPIADIIELKK